MNAVGSTWNLGRVDAVAADVVEPRVIPVTSAGRMAPTHIAVASSVSTCMPIAKENAPAAVAPSINDDCMQKYSNVPTDPGIESHKVPRFVTDMIRSPAAGEGIMLKDGSTNVNAAALDVQARTERSIAEAATDGFLSGPNTCVTRKAWHTACEKAGWPGMLRHDFRRTAVRNMVNKNIPERVAMTVTGHKTRAVFDRYHIVSPGDVKEVARRLTGTFSGTPEGSALAAGELSVRP